MHGLGRLVVDETKSFLVVSMWLDQGTIWLAAQAPGPLLIGGELQVVLYGRDGKTVGSWRSVFEESFVPEHGIMTITQQINITEIDSGVRW